MPRKPISYTNIHPYHVSARSNNRDWFDLPKNYCCRYKPCLITTPEYYAACIKYVYRNPVQAGLVNKVEDYRFSSISSRINILSRLVMDPIHGHSELLPTSHYQKINWYNQTTADTENLGIKLALRRSEFKLSQQKQTGKKIQLSAPN